MTQPITASKKHEQQLSIQEAKANKILRKTPTDNKLEFTQVDDVGSCIFTVFALNWSVNKNSGLRLHAWLE